MVAAAAAQSRVLFERLKASVDPATVQKFKGVVVFVIDGVSFTVRAGGGGRWPGRFNKIRRVLKTPPPHTSPSPRTRKLDLRSGSGSVSEGAFDGKADVTCTCSDSTFVEMSSGKLTSTVRLLSRLLFAPPRA